MPQTTNQQLVEVTVSKIWDALADFIAKSQPTSAEQSSMTEVLLAQQRLAVSWELLELEYRLSFMAIAHLYVEPILIAASDIIALRYESSL